MSRKTRVDKRNAPVVWARQETQLLRLKESELAATVAASLFCCMDDEVDVWASSMRRAATVSLPSDEWRQYGGLLETTGAQKISSQLLFSIFAIFHFWQISNKLHCFPPNMAPPPPLTFLFCPRRPSPSVNRF